MAAINRLTTCVSFGNETILKKHSRQTQPKSLEGRAIKQVLRRAPGIQPPKHQPIKTKYQNKQQPLPASKIAKSRQMRRRVIDFLFGGTIALGACAITTARSSGGGGPTPPHQSRPSRARSKPSSQASRLNAGLSRGGSSSLPSDDLLDLFDDGESAGGYDASSFFDDGSSSFGLDGDDDGLELDSLGDSSDEGGEYERDDLDDAEEEDFGQGSEKGALYDAYNLLHSLAQVSSSTGFDLQIDARLMSQVPLITFLPTFTHFRTFKSHLMHQQWS